jgi:hypothetical protein
VKEAGRQDGGGNYVLIDHGNDYYQGQRRQRHPRLPRQRTTHQRTRTTPGATYDATTFANASVYAAPGSGSPTGTLYGGTNYVYCKVLGPDFSTGAGTNHWWLLTDPDEGPANQYVSAYYLSLWGDNEAKDDSGNVIPDC